MSDISRRQASCPLCGSPKPFFYHADVRRQYLQCPQCDLVFVPKQFHPARDAEKREYDLHENSSDDPGYRNFLSRLTIPLVPRLEAGARGLDFGCGPGPALIRMLQEQGFAMSAYDPFYAPDTEALETRYDFITATEVMEHLHTPGRDFRMLLDCLRPGGWLGIMTKLVLNPEAFSRWHYKNDQTHVCFFSQNTFNWLADTYRLELEFAGKDVILLRKPADDYSKTP